MSHHAADAHVGGAVALSIAAIKRSGLSVREKKSEIVAFTRFDPYRCKKPRASRTHLGSGNDWPIAAPVSSEADLQAWNWRSSYCRHWAVSGAKLPSQIRPDASSPSSSRSSHCPKDDLASGSSCLSFRSHLRSFNLPESFFSRAVVSIALTASVSSVAPLFV